MDVLYSEVKGANCHLYLQLVVTKIANFGSHLKEKSLKNLKGRHFHI